MSRTTNACSAGERWERKFKLRTVRYYINSNTSLSIKKHPKSNALKQMQFSTSYFGAKWATRYYFPKSPRLQQQCLVWALKISDLLFYAIIAIVQHRIACVLLCFRVTVPTPRYTPLVNVVRTYKRPELKFVQSAHQAERNNNTSCC